MDEQNESTQPFDDSEALQELMDRVSVHITNILEHEYANPNQDPFQDVYEATAKFIAHGTILYGVLRNVEERLFNAPQDT